MSNILTDADAEAVLLALGGLPWQRTYSSLHEDCWEAMIGGHKYLVWKQYRGGRKKPYRCYRDAAGIAHHFATCEEAKKSCERHLAKGKWR